MNAKRPRILDFNAPLLSTRRPSTATCGAELSRSNSLSGSCFRVPFSWEQSPGKPKDTGIGDGSEEKALPLPKPPPVRWLEESVLVCDDNFNSNVDASIVDVDTNDIGNTADEFENGDEEEDDDDDNDSFSDAIDLFSLAESLNLSDNPEKGTHTIEDEDLDSQVSVDHESTSPNFMIQKFLPAATALAASSLSTIAASQEMIRTSADRKKHSMPANPRSKRNDRSCVPRRGRPRYTAPSSARGCGLEMLFPWPWRAKHKLCGVKSPVRNAHASLKSYVSPSNNK